MVAYFNPHTGPNFHLYIWILILLNSMVSYEAKGVVNRKKEKENKKKKVRKGIDNIS